MDEHFGPYRLLSRLGRGGMAETFLAERVGPARFVQQVCLKRILPTQGLDPDWVRFFQEEARLAATLRHSNIVGVNDFGEDRGVWWMTLELVEGIDLRSVLSSYRAQKVALPPSVAVFIAIELTKALVYAHARTLPDGTPAKLVHRDVTPGNVLLSYSGEVKLGDFGIAKVAYGERTQTGITKGKAPYMAPEQAMGEPMDGRVDLFALGVVLFEMLAGTRPFQGATQLAVLKNIFDGNRLDLRELAPSTPAPLIEIVESLLATERMRRMRSADDLLDALGAVPVTPNVVRTVGAVVRSVRPQEVVPSEGVLTEVSGPGTRRG